MILAFHSSFASRIRGAKRESDTRFNPATGENLPKNEEFQLQVKLEASE